MDGYLEVKRAFKELRPERQRLLMLDLLFDGTIDYVDLSNAYVKALEKQHEIESRRLHKSSMFLVDAWEHIPPQKQFTRAGAAYAILNSGEVRGASIEKQFETYLVDNPYAEDEAGFPETELKNNAGRGRPKKQQAAK